MDLPPLNPLPRTRAQRAFHNVRYLADSLKSYNVSDESVVGFREDIEHLPPNDRQNLITMLDGYNISQRSRDIILGDRGNMKRKRLSRRKRRVRRRTTGKSRA